MTKKDSKRPNRTKSNQHAFRLTDDDTLAFEPLANAEGYQTIAAWAEDLVRRRAAIMQEHLESGTFVTIHGKKIPYTEVPGSSLYECKLFNAQAIMSQSMDETSMMMAANWLADVQAHGTEDQIERSKKVSLRLPHSIRTKLPGMVEQRKEVPF